MSRIRNAWRALMGKVEVREVVAASELAKAYQVTDWSYHIGGGLMHAYRTSRRIYESCVQAYADEPGRRVEEVRILKIGGKSYAIPDSVYLSEVSFQPKPKRAKGAK